MNMIKDKVTSTNVNDGSQHTLRELIVSGDITDKSILNIFDADQRFLCRGHWYEDRILKYGEEPCKSRKAGTGLSITVILLEMRKKDEKPITNRRRMMKELSDMSDADLYTVLNPALLEKSIYPAMCRWCEEQHDGVCPEADTDDRTCEEISRWWSAKWDGMRILDAEAAE